MFRIVPQLTVKNVVVSLEFYRDLLGFIVEMLDPLEAPVFVSLSREEATLFLVSRDAREDAGKIDDLEIFKVGVGVRIYMEVDNARALYDSLKAAGARINRDLVYNEKEDYTEFSILDPDDYEIGIYS